MCILERNKSLMSTLAIVIYIYELQRTGLVYYDHFAKAIVHMMYCGITITSADTYVKLKFLNKAFI